MTPTTDEFYKLFSTPLGAAPNQNDSRQRWAERGIMSSVRFSMMSMMSGLIR
jgi:hypothetical protein